MTSSVESSNNPGIMTLKNLLSLLDTAKRASQILQIHGQLITTNTIVSDGLMAAKLLDSAISNFPNLSYAELIFLQIQHPDKTTYMYNNMIKAHVSNSNSNPKRGFGFFVEMKRNGLSGDNYTYPFVLKACKLMCGLWEGRQVHGEVVKVGFLDWNSFVRNGLIGMYCKCGEMGCARVLFDGFERDLVSWNLMLGGYVENGDMVEAQKVFDEMPHRDVASWSIIIDGYGKTIGDVTRARMLFDKMPKRDLVSWNSMIDLYAKVGDMVVAGELFGLMEHKNVISWSIMIDGYAKHGDPKESLNMFNMMLSENIKPDRICMVGAMSACAQLGALDQGRWIHMYMKRKKISADILVNTALVDMYMKCGSTEDACAVFHGMSERNVVTWNVMISGLGINGFGKEALRCFAQMEKEGVQMDDLLFISVLSACSHAGFVKKGLEIFQKIHNPKLEHYGCIIDLLCRAGELGRALTVIESMPMEPNSDLWGSLLLGCRTQRNVVLGELVVKKLVELKADDSGVYTLMSNIYADVGMWEGVRRIRRLMRERDVIKESGKSVIEVDGTVEEFVSGKMAHVQGNDIETILFSLSNSMVKL